MKIFTLGNGFVAGHLSYDKILDRVENNPLQIKNILEKYKPDVLINTIGYTGRPNIDACENNKEKTFITNTAIPVTLAFECDKLGIKFINIGSGCIFSGESKNLENNNSTVDLGWKEDDFANPKSYYSNTKYSCDLAIGLLPHVTTLRIRMPISTQNNPRNFINKIRGYNQIIDIPNSVTFMDDLTRCIDWVIAENKSGVFHVTNPDPLSATDVMKEYQKYKPEHTFTIIDEQALDKITIAKRSNCILNGSKLKDAGFKMTPTKTALEDCMNSYIKNI